MKGVEGTTPQNLLSLGIFGLPPCGRTPFHYKERTRSMSSVACEGSHMKDFDGVGL